MIYIGVHHGYHFRKPFGDIPRWTSLGRRVNTCAPGGLALLNAADAFVAAPTPAAPSLRGSAVAQARVDCTAAWTEAQVANWIYWMLIVAQLAQVNPGNHLPLFGDRQRTSKNDREHARVKAQSTSSSNALPALACGGAVAAAAVAAQRTGQLVDTPATSCAVLP